jgi:riboflavin kinase/FMN adenylyltransferase
MKVHYSTAQLPGFKNAVVTIGTFDGVHTGHRQIIRQLQTEAAAIDGETVLITFHPHPKMVIPAARHDIKVLNTLEEKISLLEGLGIRHLVVVPFTIAFAEQSAEEYISNFLVANFHPHTIIIGYDHRFGKERKGDYHLLEDAAAENHYMVKEIPEHVLQNSIISSTKIREALLHADIATANEFLGYDYFFSGKVIEGNKLGKTIGYPTANLQVEDENKLVPGNGVYAVEVEIQATSCKLQGGSLQGMMNIGIRPTVGGIARVIEVNIFDFDEDIYSSVLKVTVKKRLRDEVKFSGLDALKIQLAKDKVDALAALDT